MVKIIRDSAGNTIRSKKPFRKTFKKISNKNKFVTKAELNKTINVSREHKYLDSEFNGLGIPVAGDLTNCTLIPQGSTDLQRVGDKCMPTSLVFKGTFLATTTVSCQIRHIIFRWIPNTGIGNPTLATILQNTANALTVPSSPLHHDQRAQFEVLYDNYFALNAVDDQTQTFKFVLPLAKKTIKFSAATTVAANHIFQLLVSTITTNAPTLNGFIRVNFTDA